MINVLIAEDELLIRMGLETSIPWEDLGFHIVAAVSDGQKAWDAYRRFHPDVLITDIRMPKLDGMELMKRIREEDQACKIIVITCVEYFDALIQSLNLNITGCLLKASMTQNQLYNLLGKVKRELEDPSGADTLSNFNASDSQRFTRFLTEHTLSSAEFLPDLKNAGMKPDVTGYLLTVYHTDIQKKKALFSSIHNILKDEISSLGNLMTCQKEDRAYFYLQPNVPLHFSGIASVMDNICTYIQDVFSLPLRYVYACAELFTDLPSLADTSDHYLNQPYFFPDQSICAVKDQPVQKPFGILERMRNNRSCYAFFPGQIQKDFFQMIDELKHTYGFDSRAFDSELTRLTEFLSDFCFMPSMQENLDTFHSISFSNAPDALQKLSEIIPQYTPNPLYATGMLESIHYIHEHYSEPISLSILAKRLNLSPNYYAILFRKMTDFTFSDFIMGVRMYHARHMLYLTDSSISQIADNCGFSDAAYFAKTFRQLYGISPRQYRNKKRSSYVETQIH